MDMFLYLSSQIKTKCIFYNYAYKKKIAYK